jgi:hypothetical protein
MDGKTARQRQELLLEMARIERMETGSLSEEYREAPGPSGQSQRHGPYFKHQAWVAGRNRTRRVPASEAPALREAVEGRQRFESLSAKFIELTVAATRGEDPSKKNSAKLLRKSAAAKRKRS